MASIVLSTAGAALGNAIGPIGGFIGSQLGRAAGGLIDSSIFGGDTKLKGREGARLSDLMIQSSTYGKMIPIVYGSSRVAGNVIWARPIQEVATTTTSSAGGKGGGGKVTQKSTTYSYFASMAIALGEGPIDEVLRVWADAKQLDLSQGTYRLYYGDEEQLPDSLMESFEGSGNVPAYRGMAYVVIEDFPLADFGNRIPNFTFEVRRRVANLESGGVPLEEMIEGVTMIPGGGEFVYDTQVAYKVPGEQVGSKWVQQGNQERLNMHNASGEPNALLSLDQLQSTLPNVGWINVIVSWFGDNLDAGTCIIKPGVEYQEGATTAPDVWSVGSFTRATARQVTLVDGSPRYGGTPDDASLLRYLTELKDRGYNILFTPMVFMDISGKPWRGELTGSAANVASFFTKTNGYNAFISHYATLVKDHVDAFAIGSEMVGLTRVTDSPGSYPGVSALVSLAAAVKGIVEASVKVTYAADWSEYHHADGGWYHMDPLWSSSNIDVIGIDAYFPLTDAPQSGYDLDEAVDGWTSGEGYDFYYTDPGRTTTAPLSEEFAWKNIQWFWENEHVNPDASTTAWVPESKKIWFTEYGFPSVDAATNQPNVFYDPTTSGSALPYHSKGRIDLRAQRLGITATQLKWQGSPMVERKFLWTWDARPFPYWPDLARVWTDGSVWKTGHWIQGKLGISGLAAIVQNLCERAGCDANDLDVSRLTELVEGFVLTSPQSVRSALEQLQGGYFFECVESDGQMKFVPRRGNTILSIPENDLLPRENEDRRDLLLVTRQQELELPQQIGMTYINRLNNYQPGNQLSQRLVSASRHAAQVSLPIVMSDQAAKVIADVTLFSEWVGRLEYQCDLPSKYAALEPTDVIQVTVSGKTHTLRILSIQMGANGVLRVRGVAEEPTAYDFYAVPGVVGTGVVDTVLPGTTRLEMLDIPALPGDEASAMTLRVAGSGYDEGWRGAAIYRSDDGGSSYARTFDLETPATIGDTTDALGDFSGNFFDHVNTVTVNLLGEAELASTTELGVLNGANLALIGDELMQFLTATLVSPGKYTLSGLLRGRLGTEHETGSHAAGDRFILIDARVNKQVMPAGLIGLERIYKPVTIGATVGETAPQDFTYTAKALKPLSPAHIAGARDGAGNLSLSWTRRTRLGGDWRDGVDVPLNEEKECYEVDILDGSDVVRTISVTSPLASYSAAEQAADFGSAQSSLNVRVYQISATVGRGTAGVASI